MIIHRKITVIGTSDFSIWQYDTVTKRERTIFYSDGCNPSNDWSTYTPVPNPNDEHEERISKKEAHELMFLERI